MKVVSTVCRQTHAHNTVLGGMYVHFIHFIFYICFYIECVFKNDLLAKCKRQFSVPFLSCSRSRVDHVYVFLFS